MGRYIVAVDATWDKTTTVDWAINYWWAVYVTGIQDMVNKVLTEVGDEKISNLVIVGHGKPGVQYIGGGQHPTIDGQILMLDSFGEGKGTLLYNAESILSRLRSKFEWNGKVSLTGCETGQGIKGDKLLKRISNAVGVMAEAGTTVQNVTPGYEGSVRRCNSFMCWTLPASWSY